MKKLVYISFLFLSAFTTIGQDIQLSQYYAAPMFLNPAFVGASRDAKVGMDYRNQWSGIGKGYRSTMAFGQINFEDYRSGVGLSIINQTEGTGKLRVNSIHGAYSYAVPTKNFTVLLGLEAGYGIRSVDPGKLQFGDQFSNNGLVSNSSIESFTNATNGYADLGTGALLYTEHLFLGFSAKHLNRPNISFFNDQDKLGILYSVHGGYQINLTEPTGRGRNTSQENKSLIFTSHFKKQNAFTQFDLGAYLVHELIVLGVWYRGIPITKNNGNESIVTLVGFNMEGAQLGYSYDFSITKLRGLGSSVHEISLTYDFEVFTKNKLHVKRGPKMKYKRLPCTEFLK